MSAWCPRCDELRSGFEAGFRPESEPGPGPGRCPECGAELAELERPRARLPAPDPEAAADPAFPVSLQPPRSRLRAALLVTAVALSGLGYVAGHAGGQPARAAGASATTSTTTSGRTFEQPLQRRGQPAPRIERRPLGWHASAGGVTLTLDAVARTADQADPSSDATAVLIVRVAGLSGGQHLLGLQGLELLDAGGGVFAAPAVASIGRQRGVAANTDDTAPGTYLVSLGPAPSPATLAKVQLQALIVSQPPRVTAPLGSVPPGADRSATLQALPQGSGDQVQLPLERAANIGRDSATVELSAAFVSAHRAVLVVTADFNGSGAFASEQDVVPFTVALLADGREVCGRSDEFGASQSDVPSVTLDCATSLSAGTKLSAAFGAATATVAFPRAMTR